MGERLPEMFVPFQGAHTLVGEGRRSLDTEVSEGDGVNEWQRQVVAARGEGGDRTKATTVQCR